jgi:hypothetical protein
VSLLQAKIGEVAAVLLVAGALGTTVSPALAASGPGPDPATQSSPVRSGPAPDPAPRTDSTPANSAQTRPSGSSGADAGPVASSSSPDISSRSSADHNSESSSHVNPGSTNAGGSTSSAIVDSSTSGIEAGSVDQSPPTSSTVTPASDQPIVTHASDQPIVTHASDQPIVTHASDQPIVTAPVVAHRPARTRTTTRHETPHDRYIMPGILHRRVMLGSAPEAFASLQLPGQPGGADSILLLVAALAMAAVVLSGLSLHQRLRRLGQSGPSGGTMS